MNPVLNVGLGKKLEKCTFLEFKIYLKFSTGKRASFEAI
jgi:hypothetical protein